MVAKKHVEVAAGGALLLMGIWLAAYSLQYKLGEPSNMKAGFFPFAVGILILPCAASIIFGSLGLVGKASTFDWQALVVVLGAILVFAVCIPMFGAAPAVFLLVALFTLGSRASSPVETVVIAAVLAALACLLFIVGLGLPMRIVKWDLG